MKINIFTKLKKSFLAIGIISFAFLSLNAANQAKVIAMTGTAEMLVQGETEWKAIKTGDSIPLGAKIKTGDNSNLFLTPLPGITSTIGSNAEIALESSDSKKDVAGKTTQAAILALVKGSMSHDLNTKGTDTDFKVRTPKGVAAARGTLFTMDETGALQILEGTVDQNGTSYPEGSIVYNDPVTNQPASVTSFSDLPQSVKSQVSAAATVAVAQQVVLVAQTAGTGNTATAVASAAKTATIIAANLSENPAAALEAATSSIVKSGMAAAGNGAGATTGLMNAVAQGATNAMKGNSGLMSAVSKAASQAVVEVAVEAGVDAAVAMESATAGLAAGAVEAAAEAGMDASAVMSAVSSGATEGAVAGAVGAGVDAVAIVGAASSGATEGAVTGAVAAGVDATAMATVAAVAANEGALAGAVEAGMAPDVLVVAANEGALAGVEAGSEVNNVEIGPIVIEPVAPVDPVAPIYVPPVEPVEPIIIEPPVNDYN